MVLNCGAGEDSWESKGLYKEIKPVNPKGKQLWIFKGRTDAEAEASILWLPDAKSQLIGQDPDAGKNWGQKDRGAAEDGMGRQHHRLNGYEFEQTLGDTEGQGSLTCCSPQGCKELDTSQWLNNNFILSTDFIVTPQYALCVSEICWIFVSCFLTSSSPTLKG